MVALMNVVKAQRIIAMNLRERRLQLDLTQEGLAQRSGVPLGTLRKFEQQGIISLEAFLKIMLVLGMLDAVVKATEMPEGSFATLDEIIAIETVPKRKRGRKT